VIEQKASMRLWAWWKGDPLPVLPKFPGFHIEETADVTVIQQSMYISPEESTRRLREGHRAYLAKVGEKPVAFGWSAINRSAFGSPSVIFHVSPRNRYLYHFVTLLPWRGKGLYPSLLQAIITKEAAENDRFWIIHQYSNLASQRGITKAGFQLACDVHHITHQKFGLMPNHNLERARAGSILLGLPLIIPNQATNTEA
jgi:hypothetical protein